MRYLIEEISQYGSNFSVFDTEATDKEIAAQNVFDELVGMKAAGAGKKEMRLLVLSNKLITSSDKCKFLAYIETK